MYYIFVYIVLFVLSFKCLRTKKPKPKEGMRDHYFIISLFNNDCVVPLKKDKIVCVEDYKSIESKRGFFGKAQHMYMKCYHNTSIARNILFPTILWMAEDPSHSCLIILFVIV